MPTKRNPSFKIFFITFMYRCFRHAVQLRVGRIVGFFSVIDSSFRPVSFAPPAVRNGWKSATFCKGVGLLAIVRYRSILVVSSYFRQDITETADDKIRKVLEIKIRAGNSSGTE